MSDKKPFMFLIRPNERQTLKQLAKTFDRSEGATVRLLIRNAAQVLAEFPPVDQINLRQEDTDASRPAIA